MKKLLPLIAFSSCLLVSHFSWSDSSLPVKEAEQSKQAETQLPPVQVFDQYWQPAMNLLGSDSKSQAISKMQANIDLHHHVFNHNIFEKSAEDFLSNFIASLKAFDLKDLYQSLPDQQGEKRQVVFAGQRVASESEQADENKQAPISYLAKMVPTTSKQANELPVADGDFVAQVAMQPNTTELGNSFVLHANLASTIPAPSWQAILASIKTELELFQPEVYGRVDIAAPWSLAYRDKLKQMGRNYGEEDLELLLPSLAVFPASFDVLARMGQLTNLRVANKRSNKKQPYEKLRATFHLQPEQVEKHYPELAAYINRFKSIFTARLDFVHQGQKFLRVSINSHRLEATVESYLQNDCLLAFNGDGPLIGNQVCIGKDIDFQVITKVNSNLLGISSQVKGIITEVAIRQQTPQVHIQTRTQKIPKVKVEGSAFGIMPISLINMVMPTNIDELIVEFLTVAMTGNNGQGIATDTAFSSNEKNGVLLMQNQIGVELRDSFLVRFAAAAINERLIPTSDQGVDIRLFISDVLMAVRSDLDLYKRQPEVLASAEG